MAELHGLPNRLCWVEHPHLGALMDIEDNADALRTARH
jgi:hypothetical protein